MDFRTGNIFGNIGQFNEIQSHERIKKNMQGSSVNARRVSTYTRQSRNNDILCPQLLLQMRELGGNN